MSSIVFGNGSMPSNDDTSNATMPLTTSGAIIAHPYLTSNTNSNYPVTSVVTAASAVSASSSLGPYQHYYGHSVPQQQFLQVPSGTPFYPTVNANPLPHHGDFSNSSSSVASSSSSIESTRKTSGRKRPTDKNVMSNKSTVKRKAVGQRTNVRVR
jgi:hypothetical protein